MPREQVICDVVWIATVSQLDGSGRNITGYESLGNFDTERDADQKLADEGFTRTKWGWGGWERNRTYQIASVSRVLIEQK